MTLEETLAALLPIGKKLGFGELHLRRTEDALFTAHHREDANEPNLHSLDSARELREWAKYDDEGAFRPLKTAPNLRKGWITRTPEAQEFLSRLDAIYPGLFATWVAYTQERLRIVPLRETLKRQSGMYRISAKISTERVEQIRKEFCARNCLRTILWPSEEGSAHDPFVPEKIDEIPLLCSEACTLAINHARVLALEESLTKTH